MAKINFIKGQRPNPKSPFDGVYNNGGELSIGTEIVGSKKLYFVYNTESGKKSSYYDSEMEAKNQLNKMKNNLVGGMTYGDGGEVAEKIKGRLAKGSFELPMEMIVYVPSTKDGNIIIPKADFQARVKSVRAYLATKFGGFSSNPTDGGYMSNDNKGLIEEDVVKVTAFATKESLEENLDALLKKIQSWCKAWSQESIGFEFEGDLFYISATSKFMAGGVARDGDQDNRTMIMRQAKEVSHHVEELNEILSKQPDIDAWVVAKMQDVTTQLSEITHYLDSRVGFRLGGDDIQAVQDSMLKDGGEIILGGGNMASVQDSILAKGARLKDSKIEKEIVTNKTQDDSIHPYSFLIGEVAYRKGDISVQRIGGSAKWLVGFKGQKRPFITDAQVAETAIKKAEKEELDREKLAKGAKLKSGKLTLSKLKSMIEEYNSEGRNFELLGAYNQLELWGNDHRLETGSKEDIYRALIRYRYNPKYADGTELSNIDSMTDEEIITFANTFSYYDRMDEGIEEEFTDVEDAKEYLRMMAESE
jgi:hypothetical protein